MEGRQGYTKPDPELLSGLLGGAAQRSIRLAQPVHDVVGRFPVSCGLPDLNPIHIHHHLHHGQHTGSAARACWACKESDWLLEHPVWAAMGIMHVLACLLHGPSER